MDALQHPGTRAPTRPFITSDLTTKPDPTSAVTEPTDPAKKKQVNRPRLIPSGLGWFGTEYHIPFLPAPDWPTVEAEIDQKFPHFELELRAIGAPSSTSKVKGKKASMGGLKKVESAMLGAKK